MPFYRIAHDCTPICRQAVPVLNRFGRKDDLVMHSGYIIAKISGIVNVKRVRLTAFLKSC